MVKKTKFNRTEINFIAEQVGETEFEFKKAICLHLDAIDCQVRCYLVRVSYSEETGQFNVALCFRSENNQGQLLDISTHIFKKFFSDNEHIDFMFLNQEQEKLVRKVCCPFYTSKNFQINKADFYLTSSEGYDLEKVRACFKRKRLSGQNADGYMLCDVDPPIIGQKYGMGERNISKIIFVSRNKGYSIFDISSWPAYVHVARILVENIDKKFCINDAEVELIGWGELYRNKGDIK